MTDQPGDDGTTVVGVGTRRGADPAALLALVDDVLGGRGAGLVATSARKVQEPAVLALAGHLGAPVRAYDDEQLAAQPVSRRSDVVARHVGVPSVAEAAVLAAGARVVARARSTTATVVVGRLPRGL